jgi:hypothetical protein
MEILGDMGHVESHFGPIEDVVSVNARLVHHLRQMYHRLRNCFGHTRWYSLVTRLNWKLVLVHLEIVLILMQDSYTVCAEHIIGSEIVMDAPDGTPRYEAQVEARFDPFGDSPNLDAR